MSVRSARGFLLVVLGVLAALALPLLALTTTDNSFSALVTDARQLVGWRIAVVLLALAVGVWALLAAVEAAIGRPGRRVAALALVVLAVPGYVAWSDRYFERHRFDTVHPITAVRGDGLRGSEWRGLVLGDCRWFEILSLRFVSDSVAVGRSLGSYPPSYLLPAVIEAGTLTGPEARPARAVLRADTLWVSLEGWTGPVTVRPIGLPRTADVEGPEGP